MLIAIFVTMLIIIISIIIGFYFLVTRILKEQNPNRCYVFPYFQNTLNKPIKGKKVEKTDNGVRYSIRGKFLDVPITYPPIWHKKRITFFTDIDGDLITNLNPIKGRDFKLSSGDKDDLQFELGTSNLITQAVRAMKGKNDAMMMIIAIIIFVAGGILGFTIGKMTTQAKVITQIVTINATAPLPSNGVTITPIK